VTYEELQEGDRVQFGVGEGRQGKPRATEVEKD